FQMGISPRRETFPLFPLLLMITSLITFFNSTVGQPLITSDMNETRRGIQKKTSSYTNASALLADILNDYDIRLRPGFGGDALLLTMDIIIASFDSISEVDMDYTVTMYLHQYWKDERLTWTDDVPIDDMTLNGEFSQRIWVPDTFLANDKHSYLHDVTEKNKMLRLSRDGRIAYGMRFTSTLACSMDLRNFPLDAQNCTVEIESYGYTTSEVLMKWNHPLAVHGVDQAEVPQFRILGYQTEDSIVSTATGSYQRLSLVFQLKRSVGYFIFQTYLPCVLIVMLSWVSFWINHEATSARVALGITTVLTMTTISTGVRQSLPRISYVKSIDIYLVMCFVFVFAALLEYAAVNYSYWGRRSRRGDNECSGWNLNGEPTAMSALDRINNDDKESTMEWNGKGKNIVEVSTESETKHEVVRNHSNSNDSSSSGIDRDSHSVRRVVFRKRPSSPIPELCPDGGEAVIIDGDNPEYPRFVSGTKARPSFSIRARRRMTMAKQRTMSIKTSIHKAGKKAVSTLPSFRVKDVNVIDRYSRVIFPLCFVLFNLFYWGYYTMFAG
ncbi:gab-1, partial [Pristionchus pacificus]